MLRLLMGCGSLLLAVAGTQTAFGQGADSTPAERSLRIIAELLPGHYSNANQVYFDGRRGLDQGRRHAPLELVVTGNDGGPAPTFTWRTGDEVLRLVLGTDSGDPDHVQARFYRQAPAGWEDRPVRVFKLARAAESFAGAAADGHRLQLSRRELWLDRGDGTPDRLERSRPFHCYVDMPGVGGGRALPFERYDDIQLHDQGGEHWFTSRDAERRRLGIRLLAVNWHVLNEGNGDFNRNSLVLYVSEQLGDGTVKEHGYAFTAPEADRIGLNLKWLLVNCAMTPRSAARPEL
jgi:hypothetical protein